MSSEYENNEFGARTPENGPDPSQPETSAYRMSGSQIPGAARSGDTNTGSQNAGYQNTGYQNTGYQNAGYQNTGYQNTGYQNAGYQNRGAGYGPSDPYRANPMSGYNVRPQAPQQPKKKSGSRRVVALALVCALIGGLGGGAAVGMALRGGAANTAVEETAPAEAAAVPAPETTEEAAKTDEGAAARNENINNTEIEVTTNSETTSMTPKDVYEKYVNAVVAISNEGTTTNVFGQVSETAASGSGFIITEDGYIVTNNHVVAGAEKLTVTMTNGDEYEAEIIGADAENDVALLKIDGKDLPTVAVGTSPAIEVGQQVCAIGNPLGELTNTLTVGYVSALDREINENGTPISMFQTDCAINAGNSGGPLFDLHGNVIGITTAKYSSNGSSFQASIEGIGFCVPIDDAMDIVSDLLEYGYVKGRPSLGISCQAISSTVTQYYHLPLGVYVYEVQEGTAADKAGLQAGDIITAIDGTEVESITEFKSKLKEYSAGDTALLSIYRSDENGAETLELSVTFDEKQ